MEKKKRTLEEALRSTAFLSDGGGVASSPYVFFFCVVCDIKEGPGICCMVVVPLFSPTSSFLVVSHCGVLF